MKDLIPVLESLKISVAISLDDDYGTSDNLARLDTQSVKDFLCLYQDRFSATEIDEIEDSGVLTILQLSESGTISHATKEKVLGIMRNEQSTPPELQFLEGGFKDSSVNFKKYDALEKLPFDSEEGAIWFIDKEIGKRDILPEIIPRLSKNTLQGADTIVVVFTSDSNMNALNNSWDRRHDYLVNNLSMEDEPAKSLSYSFFVVLKSEISRRLTINEHAARDYLGDILTASMSGYCTCKMIMKMQDHAKKAFSRLLEVAKSSNQRTFQNIQYNMVKEGEPNVYHALKSILDYMQEFEYSDGFEQYSRYIMAMKRLARIPRQDAETINAQSLKDLLDHYDWAQFQFIHKDVNKTFADITYGDVFRLFYSVALDECRPYIGVLITQPCDCILRKSGGQTKRNASLLTLVLFEEKTVSRKILEQPDDKNGDKEKDNWRKKIQMLRDGAIILSKEKRGEDTVAMYIDASARAITAIQVLPFILDLTSLNNEGKAVLLDTEYLNHAIVQNKTDNWKEYYTAFEKEVAHHRARMKVLFDKLGEKANEVVCSIYKIPFSLTDSQFYIERIGHLEGNMAELISYKYIAHTYRTGKNSLLSLYSNLVNGEGEE